MRVGHTGHWSPSSRLRRFTALRDRRQVRFVHRAILFKPRDALPTRGDCKGPAVQRVTWRVADGQSAGLCARNGKRPVVVPREHDNPRIQIEDSGRCQTALTGAKHCLSLRIP
jgi:hypothetical protein